MVKLERISKYAALLLLIESASGVADCEMQVDLIIASRPCFGIGSLPSDLQRNKFHVQVSLGWRVLTDANFDRDNSFCFFFA